MADYSETKEIQGSICPTNSVETVWGRLEPLIDVKLLRNNYLFGIPLVSRMPTLDQNGNRIYQEMDDEYLANQIHRAISSVETDLGIIIMPTQIKERHPFDRNPYLNGGLFTLKKRPMASLEKVEVSSPDKQTLWQIPLEWVDMGYAHLSMLTIVPFSLGSSSYTVTPLPVNQANPASANTLFWIQGTQYMNWVSGYWNVTYTVGFKDGLLPVFVNDYIGNWVTVEVLSLLAATYATTTSHSLSMDGMSQSVSALGPQLFDGRIQRAMEEMAKVRDKIRKMFGGGIFVETL